MIQVGIIPDCHIPYEDKRAYQLMLDVFKDSPALEAIYILGDYADFYSVSSHGKSPWVKNLLKDELYEVHSRLKELRKLFPKKRIVYIEGNHEFRLARYIEKNCPDLFDLIGCEELLKLNEYEIEFVPYGPNQFVQVEHANLYARHEPISGGVHVAHGTVTKAMRSVIFGHTHRIQESQIVSIDGDNFRGISSGWLGDTSSDIFNYVKSHHQWAHGFSLVTILKDGSWFNQLCHIINYKCQANGFLYEG